MNNNELNLPPVYFQVKKIRSFWEKSQSPDRSAMLALFDETLNTIVTNALLENEENE